MTVTLRKHPVTVFVLWYGGSSYATPYADQAEQWQWADAVSECLDRFHNRDGSTPCVDESSEAQVFYADPRDSSDPYPDELVRWSHYHNTFRREACC